MRFKPLALQILQQILLYAVLFWLVASVLRAGLSFYQGQQRLDHLPVTVRALYLPGLAQGLQHRDPAAVHKVLAAIGALPGIESVRLETPQGQQTLDIRPENARERLAGHIRYRLEVPAPPQASSAAGVLTLQVSSLPIRQEIIDDLISSMAQRVLDFAALALLLVYVLRRRFVLPVQLLAQAVRAFRPGEPASALRPPAATAVADEMTVLEESIRSMQASINSHLADRQRYETELTEARDRLADRVEARTAELDRLLQFQTLIASISSRFINIPLAEIDQEMQRALARTGRFMAVDRCYLIGVDDNQTVSLVNEWAAEGVQGATGLDGAEPTARPGLFAALLRDGVLNLPRCRDLPAFAGRSQVSSLLQLRIDHLGAPVGIFGCDMVDTERAWQEEELVQARLVGELFANMILRRRQLQALEQTQQQLRLANADLARLALSDGLTGLANRRCFDDMKHRLFETARRENRPLAVIMLDIDYFKEYNDRFGHPAGDACLQRLAGQLSTRFDRPGELTARIGGEEFAVLLPDCGLAAATERAWQLCEAIRGLNIAHPDSRTADRVTVSIGVGGMDPGRHDGIEALLTEVDRALYRAKAEGRNRVC